MSSLENLAVLLDEAGATDEARELFLESLGMSRQIWGGGLNVADTLISLAQLEMGSDRPAAAEPYYVEALALFRRTADVNSHELSWLGAAHGYCLLKLGRYEESEGALLEAFELEQSLEETDDELLAEIAGDLVALYEASNRADQAAPIASWPKAPRATAEFSAPALHTASMRWRPARTAEVRSSTLAPSYPVTLPQRPRPR